MSTDPTPTPETEAALCILPPEPGWPEGRKATCHHDFIVPAPFARRLEQERDDWQHKAILNGNVALDLEQDIAKLQAANAELVEALRYARRWLKPADHDTVYLDGVLAKNQSATRQASAFCKAPRSAP